MARHLTTLIFTTGLVVSVWVAVEGWKVNEAERQRAETVRAEYYAKTAEWNASAARFTAIAAAAELESKRTTVEKEIRGIVLNEYRKCMRGKCK